jgi:basic amino acid/polyamine antiporter, APA family
LARQCALPQHAAALVCSDEALAHVLRQIGWSGVGNMLGYAAFIALPSVILVLLFAQTRIFFVMSRDGLLPEVLSRVHPKWHTPYVVTMITGALVALAAAFFPVGQLADIANAGTLYAFALVAIAVMMLRRQRPDVSRPFKVRGLWLVAPSAVVGCAFLFLNLPMEAVIVLPVWSLIGVAIYFLYGRPRSHLGAGVVEVVDDIEGLETLVPIHPPKPERN